MFEWAPDGGIEGRELIQFVGPAIDYGIETLQSFGGLRLNRKEDGTVVVLHPYWEYWSGVDYERYRSQIEWSLADFKTLMAEAHQQRVTDWGGRVGPDAYVPVVHTDANTLHDFYVDIGAYDHPDGPPVLPPATCGPAVRHPSDNHGLVLDCRTLLDVKDMLRGTAELDWSMDTRIAKWDGVKVAGTHKRVTKVELEDKGLTEGIPAQLRNLSALTHLDLRDNSLTGSVPAELAELAGLEELRLSGNRLTGCIPVGLRDVPTNDLDDLGLPDCP